MILELPIALVLAAVGMTVFHRFAEGHSYWRRVFKWAFYFGVTFLLSTTLGRTAALLWVLGLPVLGGIVHTLWCRKHGIHPVTAEPREKFYKLMGWEIGTD